MTIAWTELTVFEFPKQTAAEAPWIMALEWLATTTHLKITAEGSWKVANSAIPSCGPNGLSGLVTAADQLILPGVPFGALIGKLGGSTISHAVRADAAVLAAEDPFAIGSFCILKPPDGNNGPLFLGFNALARPIQVATLKVAISAPK